MSFISQVRAWLVFGRMHSAILETPIAILGAALAIGSLWDIRVGYWAIFGMIYHFAGYGMNSYVDWKKGFDKNDPEKKHHPLNTGEITPVQAKYTVAGSMFILISYALYLTGFSTQGLLIVLLMLISGVTYNYFGKYTRHKYIPISIVHTLVFVLPYSAYSNNFGVLFWSIVGALFIHNVYQIAISGDIKDVGRDESSLLQSMGVSVREGVLEQPMIVVPSYVFILGTVIACAEYVFLTFQFIETEAKYLQFVLMSLLFGAMIIEHVHVMWGSVYLRDLRLKAMSKKEIYGILMVSTAIMSVNGIVGMIAITLGSLLYFIPVSKFMWGQLSPKV